MHKYRCVISNCFTMLFYDLIASIARQCITEYRKSPLQIACGFSTVHLTSKLLIYHAQHACSMTPTMDKTGSRLYVLNKFRKYQEAVKQCPTISNEYLNCEIES